MAKRALLFCAAAAALCLSQAGCSFIRLKKDLAAYSEVATIEGTINAPQAIPLPLYVAVVSSDAQGERLRAYDILRTEPKFLFKVLPGKYTVFAFHDANHDLNYQRGEAAGSLGSHFDAAPGSTVRGLALTITPNPEKSVSNFITAATAEKALYVKNSLGNPMEFSSENFSRESAAMGFWEPLRFLTTRESGIFFAAPYTPRKIPVLFVHGANGTPLDFQKLAERLDTERYQAWFAYYPSGLDLDISSVYLKRSLVKLQQQFGFKQMAVVAHSMGGLVARRMILELAADGNEKLVPAFISISSPWNGHVAAGLGVERSPAVVPSWEDIAPGSEYLVGLYQKRFPKELRHTLLFGYQGKTSMIMANNDGVVELSSVLLPEAQAEAKLVKGYNADHVQILQLEEVARAVDEALAEAFYLK